MKVRISFRSEIVVEGDTIEQVREKWEMMPLYSDEAHHHGIEFVEIDSVEDANTYKDLRHEFEQP